MKGRIRALVYVICLSLTISLFGCSPAEPEESRIRKTKNTSEDTVMTEDTELTDESIETSYIDPDSSELLKTITLIESYLGGKADYVADSFIKEFDIKSYILNRTIDENDLTFFGKSIKIDDISYKNIRFWKIDGKVQQIDLSVSEQYDGAASANETTDMNIPVKEFYLSVFQLLESKYGKAADYSGPAWMDGTAGDRVIWNDGDYTIRLCYVENSKAIDGNNLFRIEIGYSVYDPSSPENPEPFQSSGPAVQEVIKIMQSCIGKEPAEAKALIEKMLDVRCGQDQFDDHLEYEEHTHNGRYLIDGVEYNLVKFYSKKATGKVYAVRFYAPSGGNQFIKTAFKYYSEKLTILYGQPVASNSIDRFQTEKYNIDQNYNCYLDAAYSDDSSYRDLGFMVIDASYDE